MRGWDWEEEEEERVLVKQNAKPLGEGLERMKREKEKLNEVMLLGFLR